MENIAINAEFVKHVRSVFEQSGIPVAEWARKRGFSTGLVYQVLEGKRKCIRGQSHRIAVALGLKVGAIVELDDLISNLQAKAPEVSPGGRPI